MGTLHENLENIIDYNIDDNSSNNLKIAIKENKLKEAHHLLSDQIIKKLGLLKLKPHSLKIRNETLLFFNQLQKLSPDLNRLALPQKKEIKRTKPTPFSNFFKIFFSENNWKTQCNGKFGGQKPPKISWKHFYQKNQSDLESLKDPSDLFVWATIKGHIILLRKLINKHKNIFKKSGKLLLFIAIKNNDNHVVRLLIENKINIETCDENKWSVLHWSTHLNNQEISKYLINLNAKLNKKTNNGLTALHFATINGNSNLVDSLIKKGSFLNCKEHVLNLNPLQLAFFKKQFTIFNQLINNNINFNVSDELNRNLLHWASILNYPNICQTLLKKNIDPNQQDISGRTAAHWAAQNGHLEVLNHLINYNCNLNIKDNFKLNVKETASFFTQESIYNKISEHSTQFF